MAKQEKNGKQATTRNTGLVEVKTLTMGLTQEHSDFLDKMAEEHGVPKWHVVADGLDAFIAQYAKDGAKCFGVRLNAKAERAAEQEKAKAAREQEKAERAKARDAEKLEKVKPIADELGNLSGVNTKQATALAEQFRSWGKLAKATVEELTAAGVSKTAAARITEYAAEKGKDEKKELSKKRAANGAKRNPASKTLKKYKAEQAAEILGITRRKVRTMAEAGELMSTDEGESVMLPLNIKSFDEGERLAIAKSVVK